MVERSARRLAPACPLLKESEAPKGLGPRGSHNGTTEATLFRAYAVERAALQLSSIHGWCTMISSRRLVPALFVVVASIWGARSAHAQETSRAKSAKVEISASDSATIADVQKAADDLARAVQEAVKKATEDPAVKVAALKVATNAVTAAQLVVTQQAATLQTLLDTLAREIAQATEKQSKSKSH
jgi:hypothetical protein